MQNKFINCLFWTFSLFIWCSCSTSSVLSSDFAPVEKDSLSADYSIIYMIHGDASYLYHDSSGKARQADEDVLDEAISIAKEARSGEVYIFHQKPERNILWLFPRKDRVFMYFRNGQLIHKEKYSPEDSILSFAAESRLYQQHRIESSVSADRQKVFLYFGHEIPLREGRRYHSSRPSAPFSIRTFDRGLRSFLASDQSFFNLTVLSTCNNGTPDMAAKLLPYINYLLASPQNLHLSHIDTKALLLLEQNPGIDTYELAHAMAEQTYERLTEFIQTTVSLSIYNLAEAKSYLPDLASSYSSYLEDRQVKPSNEGNKDCNQLPFFEKIANPSGGVKTWYRASRFGQKTNARHYSGWGCK